MKIKGLIDEDFVNFKLPSLYIAMPNCSFKCEKECGRAVCQNGALAQAPIIEIDEQIIIQRFRQNPITQAIIFAGLEPFDSGDFYLILSQIRADINEPIVIYTGYTEQEINKNFKWIYNFKNIIIKYGRYIPNQQKHYDEILGVYLASDNQYARWYN